MISPSNSPRDSVGFNPKPDIDPWRAAEPDASLEASSNWLLSYSDLMTLLFTFFVMLFAYQKALPGKPVESASNPPVASAQPAAAPAAVPEPAAAMHIAHAPSPMEPALDSRLAEPALAAAATTMGEQSTPATAHQPTVPPASRWLSATLAPPPEAAKPTALAAAQGFGLELGKDIEISEAPGQLRLEIGDSILFDPASAELKHNGAGVLDRLAQWLRAQPGAIAVEGHTDDRPMDNGRYRSNWELSAARAGTVARGLIERGIPPDRLQAVGLADTHPRVDNATPAGRSKNRRVALVVFIERGKGVKI